ncbi:hypothetical protein [Roseisolibacter sp. H3M3-2]|uniref:hypothetical protein n=1 Tax=Roseisolibacter sp. H3M3-2 TaxID=3031323 RepID=UPI0023DAAA45|nr:hypothetical protein [Roseisolibacter sp. H3M3-2]MDF1505802.1 hypothetical protein [Roseisolibacter sp. H3M3-2]
MTRRAWPYLAGLSVALALPRALDAQHPTPAPAARPVADRGAPLRTAPQKIQDALAAAPASVAAQAAVVDWPMAEGASMRELRPGTNGWVCHPTTPAVFAAAAGRDPMCLDAEWQQVVKAWAARAAPTVTRLGFAYMLQGDAGVSNSDPFATARTADNDWVVSGPHVMLVSPDRAAIEALPSDPKNGGPWVMWKGTPYAHVMIPIPSAAAPSARAPKRAPQ